MATGQLPAGVLPVLEGGTGVTSLVGLQNSIGIYSTAMDSNSTASFNCQGYLILILAQRGTNHWYGTIDRWGTVQVIKASANDLLTVTITPTSQSLYDPVITVKYNYALGALPILVISSPFGYLS